MNRRKNAFWLSLFIIIPLVATATMVDVVKASPTKVSVDYYGKSEVYDITLVPTEQFTINITVDYVAELWGYQFIMIFNPDVLHGVKVENGPFLESAGGTAMVHAGMGFDNEQGWLFLFFAGLYPMRRFPTGGGTLAYVTFEVVGIGASPLTLGVETGLLNKTGGWQFDGEWCYGWYKPDPRDPEEPYQPWRDSLGHGYFDNRPPVYVDPSLVKGISVDNNFTVNVNVADIQDLYGWESFMSWNATLLNVTSVVEGDFLMGQPEGTSFFSEIHNDAGFIRVNCSTVGSYPGVDGDGTLATVTFLVKERGTSNLALYNTRLLDSAQAQIDVRTANGTFTNLETHDIAITSVTPHPDEVEEGSNETISIDVTVENRGDYNETDIKVTAYYDENEIGNETISSLYMGNSTTLTFMWNTTGVHRGKYVLSARAETETAEGSYTYGLLTISVHDIAIVSVTTLVANVYVGTNITISVDVRNEGTELKNVTVTAYYDGNEIDTLNIPDFDYGESTVLEFTWDTTGVAIGEYTISAEATVVEGEEDTADNTFTKVGKVNVIPVEEAPFPTELLILIIIPVVIIGATTVFYLRRRKRPPEIPG